MADKDPKGVLPLYEPEGFLLQVDAGGKGFYDKANQAADDGGIPRASLDSRSSLPRSSLPSRSSLDSRSSWGKPGMSGTDRPLPTKLLARGAPKAERPLTPDELMALANQMETQMNSQHEASLAQGPQVAPRENFGDYADLGDTDYVSYWKR